MPVPRTPDPKDQADERASAPVPAVEAPPEPAKPRLDMQQPRGTVAESVFSAAELAHHAEEFGAHPWDVIGCMAALDRRGMTKDELRAALPDFLRRSV